MKKSMYELTDLECDLLSLLIDVEIYRRDGHPSDELESIYSKMYKRLDEELAYHPLTLAPSNDKFRDVNK